MERHGHYSVGEVARLSGVTVRTLHYYDEIGLLQPRVRSGAGYRGYDRVDLDRLQRILAYRELGFSLDRISVLVDDRASDDVKHLRTQHALLTDRITRLRAQLAVLEKTLEARQMGITLTPQEIFEVFGDYPLGEYADESEARWGETPAGRESERRTSSYGKDDWERIKQETAAIEQQFLASKEAGEPADSPAAMAAAEAHRKNISRWFYECDYDMHRGLADMYVGDPRFAAHYDRLGSGVATFVHDAIYANADRASAPPSGR